MTVAALGALTVGLGSRTGAALILTPSQGRGPFYPPDARHSDNNLVRVDGEPGVATGQITNLVGQVVDELGQPSKNALVEIWQCNAYGRYHHPGDSRAKLDPYFQGYGATRTDGSGRYRFRTIKPVAYPGRAPHIHFAVRTLDGVGLVTQLYVAGSPENLTDRLLRRIESPAARASVIAVFEPDNDDPHRLIARFSIVVPKAAS